MAVITLTTDWNTSDYYIGAVKGKILSRSNSVVIVDVNHYVAPFNIMQASFILSNCYKDFPDNTIHILGVNSALSIKRSLLIIEHKKQYFLCSDCGFPSLLFPEEEVKVYKYQLKSNMEHAFLSFDIYVDVAFRIINGEKPTEIGTQTTDFVQQKPLLPTIDKDLINGSVVYIDSYSNAITNISRDIFERVGSGKPFEIFVQSNHYKINKISNTYSEVPSGELVALFNSSGLLEIAMAYGPIAKLLELGTNSVIRVKFSKGKNQLQLSGE